MLKQLILFIYDIEGISHHSLWDLDIKQCIFEVGDLSDNPEDAIIGRDLIDSYDIGFYLELGMSYSSKGYKSINIKEVYIPNSCEDINKYIKNYIETYGTKV